MTAADYTADQIVEAITLALRARDMKAVNGLMHLLAVKDPRRAQEVLDTFELAQIINRAREDGSDHG